MNVLFLTLLNFESINEKNIYTDLLREFVKNGHRIYAISPTEKRQHQETHLIKEEGSEILRIKIGNTQKTNIVEKGISTVLIEPIFIMAIKRFFSNVKFDLVLYSTPPITFVRAIEYVKKRDNAKTYLLLKDIFPQNALDLGLLSTKGIKGVIYRHFRKQEKKLYAISDKIGCMSEANVKYVINHNTEINPDRIEICPNCIEVSDKSVDENVKKKMRLKYDIPLDKKILVYGGNLGKPQGIPFLIECINKCRDIDDAFFLIVGDGTEYRLLEEHTNNSVQKNLKLMKRLPKEDYETMIGACDVGLIFLDYRFTIPNFPSRVLAYMQAKLPVLAVTDCNSDIGDIIKAGKFGWWCESNNTSAFRNIVYEILQSGLEPLGKNGFNYLLDYYTAENAYNIIVKKL